MPSGTDLTRLLILQAVYRNINGCFTIAIVKKEFSLAGFFSFKLRYTIKQHKIYLIYIMNQLLTTCTNLNVSYKLVDLQKKKLLLCPFTIPNFVDHFYRIILFLNTKEIDVY